MRAELELSIERAQRAPRGRSELAPLSAILPLYTSMLSPARSLAPVATVSTPARELERLELELSELLHASAPASWRVIRRPFYRLLRQARRELRRGPPCD